MPAEELVLPADVNQIPDIFININLTTYAPPDLSKKGKKEEEEIESNDRMGFIRLFSKNIIVNQESTRPTWHIVQSVENEKKNIGRLLVNARLVAMPTTFKRQALKESKDVQYWFFPQIFSGYELAPKIPEDQLITFLKINIGTTQREKKNQANDKQKDNMPKS